MAIELTSATTAQLSGIGTSLGVAPHYFQLLFPDFKIAMDGNRSIVVNNISTTVVDFKFFAQFKTFGGLNNIGLTTILNANVLVNLENSGTASALTLTSNSLSETTLNQLFTDLPATNKTATINVAGNPGAATCDTSIATNKGYTVTTS